MLEQQLTDKSRAAEGHVQELTHLRTLLAKEKADHAMVTHKASEKAARYWLCCRAATYVCDSSAAVSLGECVPSMFSRAVNWRHESSD